MPVDMQLQELMELWMNPTTEHLRRISMLCDDLAVWAATNQSGLRIDRQLLGRIEVLSTTAENRLEECVAIQTKTGSYSISGVQEISPSVTTAGWEG